MEKQRQKSSHGGSSKLVTISIARTAALSHFRCISSIVLRKQLYYNSHEPRKWICNQNQKAHYLWGAWVTSPIVVLSKQVENGLPRIDRRSPPVIGL